MNGRLSKKANQRKQRKEREGKNMQFSNGCWLQAEGIECFYQMEAYLVTV